MNFSNWNLNIIAKLGDGSLEGRLLVNTDRTAQSTYKLLPASYLLDPALCGWQHLNLCNMPYWKFDTKKGTPQWAQFPLPSNPNWPVKLWPVECSGSATWTGLAASIPSEPWAVMERDRDTAVCDLAAIPPTCQEHGWSHLGPFSPAQPLAEYCQAQAMPHGAEPPTWAWATVKIHDFI